MGMTLMDEMFREKHLIKANKTIDYFQPYGYRWLAKVCSIYSWYASNEK